LFHTEPKDSKTELSQSPIPSSPQPSSMADNNNNNSNNTNNNNKQASVSNQSSPIPHKKFKDINLQFNGILTSFYVADGGQTVAGLESCIKVCFFASFVFVCLVIIHLFLYNKN
jgi:hypothetical protein